VAAVVFGACTFATADPVKYTFVSVTNNNPVDVATGQEQLYMEVDSVAGGKVSFTFFNKGSEACSITDVYFDDMTRAVLALPMVITSSSGVSFSQDASPPDLPGGQTIGFTADYSADSNNGPPGTMANGVNPGEWLKIVFSLKSPATFGDVLTELHPFVNTDLRVGIHVQGFEGDGSESFIAVPVPPAVWGGAALLSMLGGFQAIRRRALVGDSQCAADE